MNTFTDYESLGLVQFSRRYPPVVESFRGSDIVDWHGRIEQSLVNLLNDAEKANNQTYATRLRTFLETWRENPIDGSLNRETIETLAAASKQWSRENWDLQSYFLSLNTKLRQLIASEEELPRDIDMTRNEPAMGGHGGGGGGGGAPPMSPSFGPEKEAGGGGGGGMGGPGEAGPGAPGGPGGPEAAAGGAPAPGEELGAGGAENPGEAPGETAPAAPGEPGEEEIDRENLFNL